MGPWSFHSMEDRLSLTFFHIKNRNEEKFSYTVRKKSSNMAVSIVYISVFDPINTVCSLSAQVISFYCYYFLSIPFCTGMFLECSPVLVGQLIHNVLSFVKFYGFVNFLFFDLPVFLPRHISWSTVSSTRAECFSILVTVSPAPKAVLAHKWLEKHLKLTQQQKNKYKDAFTIWLSHYTLGHLSQRRTCK